MGWSLKVRQALIKLPRSSQIWTLGANPNRNIYGRYFVSEKSWENKNTNY